MACLGTFVAQHFKLLSVDPNTIFQFFVFPDRLFMVKAGSALNQLPSVVTFHVVGPVGIADHARGGLPTVEEARRLVAEAAAPKATSLSSPVKSRELPLSLVAGATLARAGLLKKGLTLTLRSGGDLFFRFLDPGHEEAAASLLGQALGSRLSVK